MTESAAQTASTSKTWNLHGAGIIVFDSNGAILVTSRIENGCFELPTGGVEEGETHPQTALRELLHETGLALKESDIALVGEFDQLVPERDSDGEIIRNEQGKATLHKGKLYLYVSNRQYAGEELTPEKGEVKEIRFMTIDQILDQRKRGLFMLGSIRMILAYHNTISDLDGFPIRGALKNPVTWKDIVV